MRQGKIWVNKTFAGKFTEDDNTCVTKVISRLMKFKNLLYPYPFFTILSPR